MRLVGVAHTDSPLARWGAWGLPTTFLIDATGKIAGSTDADRVSPATIDALLHGIPLPAVEMTVRPLTQPPASAGRIGRNLLAYNGTVKVLVSRFWEKLLSRISAGALDGDPTIYEVSVALPRIDPDRFRAEACEVVAAALRINVRRDVRDVDVWVLPKNDSPPPSLQPPGTIAEISNSGWQPAIPPSLGWWIKLQNAEFSLIAELLEAAVGTPVLNETGITGRYDFKVISGQPRGEGWIEAMRKAGFRIERARRRVEYLVVSQVE